MLEFLNRTLGESLRQIALRLGEWSERQRQSFFNNCCNAFLLLTVFYGLFAVPIIGPILQAILGEAMLASNFSLMTLAGAYCRHLAFAGVQALVTLIFNPTHFHKLGLSYYQQVFGFIAALLAGTFARQIMVVANRLILGLSFVVGSQTIGMLLTSALIVALAAAPVILAMQHNQQVAQNNADEQQYSLAQMVMMSYGGFIGACFPQFSFGTPVLGSLWQRVCAWTGGAHVLTRTGQESINAAYTHLIGSTIPAGYVADTITTLFFSEQAAAGQGPVNQEVSPNPGGYRPNRVLR